MTPSMVSRALNPSGKVDEAKRRAVLAAAERLGYTPNRMASRLSMRALRIGVLLADVFSPVTEALSEGIRAAHERLRDYKIECRLRLLAAEPKDAARLCEALSELADCDGVILSGFGAACYAPVLREFAAAHPKLALLQSGNTDIPHLFFCTHNAAEASRLASEFLFRCLRRTERRVLLFTGDLETPLHRVARDAFLADAASRGLSVMDVCDMKDNAAYLEELLPSVLAKHGERIDGIYVTSGNALPLCRAVQTYTKETGRSIDLVTFDLYADMLPYFADGTIAATVFQNLSEQAFNAFTGLFEHLLSDNTPPTVTYSDVRLLLSANIAEISKEKL